VARVSAAEATPTARRRRDDDGSDGMWDSRVEDDEAREQKA
jgi:hypothetical protein